MLDCGLYSFDVCSNDSSKIHDSFPIHHGIKMSIVELIRMEQAESEGTVRRNCFSLFRVFYRDRCIYNPDAYYSTK